MANAIVYIEVDENLPSQASLVALNQGRRVSTSLGATLYAVVPCTAPPGYGEDDVVAILSRYGADKVVLVIDPKLTAPALFASHGEALLSVCEQLPGQLVILPHGRGSADIGPRLALRLDGGFVGNVRLHADGTGVLRYSRSVFGDRFCCGEPLTAAPRPLVVTLGATEQRPHEMGVDEAEVLVIQAPTTPPSLEIVGGPVKEEEAPRITIGGGAGVGGAERFGQLRRLATALGANLAASSSACAAGWADPALQVGLDGAMVETEVYLALGVSGSDRHLAGLSPGTKVVAINSDPGAPIFQVAALGLVADAGEVIEQMCAAFAAEGD